MPFWPGGGWPRAARKSAVECSPRSPGSPTWRPRFSDGRGLRGRCRDELLVVVAACVGLRLVLQVPGREGALGRCAQDAIEDRVHGIGVVVKAAVGLAARDAPRPLVISGD